MRFHVFCLSFFILALHATFAQSTASEQVTKFSIAAPQLDTVKQIWVYLPKDYQNSEKRYPVVYMHDAQNLFDNASSFVGEWQVDEYLDQLEGYQSIIIGIEHGNHKRIDELTPYKHDKYGGGNGDAYLQFIVNTLKPHVDSSYRTQSEPLSTSIFGSSLGGLISLYAIIKFPDVFGKAGLFSASFWYSDKIYDLVESAVIPQLSKFFFLCGDKESESMVPDQERMVELLKSKGVKSDHIENHIIEDGEHNEKLWSNNFGNAYLWLYK